MWVALTNQQLLPKPLGLRIRLGKMLSRDADVAKWQTQRT
jgi:hypothetical protein